MVSVSLSYERQIIQVYLEAISMCCGNREESGEGVFFCEAGRANCNVIGAPKLPYLAAAVTVAFHQNLHWGT